MQVRSITYTSPTFRSPLVTNLSNKNTGKGQKLQIFKNTNPFDFEESDEFEDIRFHHPIQVVYCIEVTLKRKKNPILPQKYVNWRACRELGEQPLNQALATLDNLGLRDIMQFRYDWNKEVIGQFYATLWYNSEQVGEDDYKRYLNFSIEGATYKCSYKRFARILGFDDDDLNKECAFL